MAFSGFPHLTT